MRMASTVEKSDQSNSMALSFVGFGAPEFNGLIFEATAFQFGTQDEAWVWLRSEAGQYWIDLASGVNMIQVSTGGE